MPFDKILRPCDFLLKLGVNFKTDHIHAPVSRHATLNSAKPVHT
jgi:hypothetical protein